MDRRVPQERRVGGRRCLALLVSLGVLSAAEPVGLDFARDIRPLLETHCYDCHEGSAGKGGVDLARYLTEADLQRDLAKLTAIQSSIHERLMPPEGGKGAALAEEDRVRLAEWLQGSLHRAYAALPADPGRAVLRRLTRTEFNNTYRDLLGIDLRPADRFPADGGGGEGFANTADTLFLPPLLLEKLLDAAERSLAAAKPDSYISVRPAPGANARARRKAAEASLLAFAGRAWRRPALPAEVSRLLRLFDKMELRQIPYDEALRHLAKAVLVAPPFVYRVEPTQSAAGAYLVGHHEMASRLSYFLWSTMPDQVLLDLAAEKKLHNEAVLRQQVARMLADPRAAALGSEFARAWMQLGPLEEGTVGPESEALRQAMLDEPVHFFNALVAQDRPLLHLLGADWTWANQELAAHYGIEGVKGPQWREVRLGDPRRSGVLGMAAMLTATSHPQRTSPVLRGRWILDRLLGAPPPPPPPNAASLPKEEKPDEKASLRSRLEAHRQDPACAGCHSRIDPLGFGLENFDRLGRWRERDAGGPLDTQGVLPSGETFRGVQELRALLLKRQDAFTRTLVEKMLGYALGRGLEGPDRKVVDDIAAAVAADGHKTRTLITAVVLSYPFRYSRNRPVAPPPTTVNKTPAPKDPP